MDTALTATLWRSKIPALLQPRILHSGLLENRDIGIAVLPRGEEILIGCARLGIFARRSQRARQTQSGQTRVRRKAECCSMIENVLELGHRLRSLFHLHVGPSSQKGRNA